MPSRKKRRIPEGELADTKGPASAAGQAPSVVGADAAGDAAGDAPPAALTSVSSSTSSHDLHANLPLFVTGPAIVQATSGAAWCHGWRLQSAKQGDDDAAALPPSPRKRSPPDHLAVPAGVVARLEAAPLGPGDVPLTARSCRVAVTAPKDRNEEAAAPPPVSRAFPQQSGAAAAAATASLPPPPPASWRAAAASIAGGARASVAAGGGPPSVVVIGPKNSGKSSFARLLTNELLSSFSTAAAAAAAAAAAKNDSTGGAAPAFSPVVAWCDVDCGQPELTPPGLASLSHVSRPLLASGGPSARATGAGGAGAVRRQPARAHFLGALSPASDPERACAVAACLLGWHWQHGGVESGGGEAQCKGKRARSWPPLVVNSPGWVRGAGLDLLRAALAAARPTHVVRLSTGNAERDAPAVFELFEGGCLPPFLEVVELPALGGSSSSGSRMRGNDAEDCGAEHGDAAAAPPSLFQGIIPTTPASTRYSAADARTASWFSFARSCVQSAAADDCCDDDDDVVAEGGGGERERGGREPPSFSSSVAADVLLLPAALAAARPMVLPLSSVRLEFLGERPSSFSNALRALNGSVVALATAAEAGKGLAEEGEADFLDSPATPSPIVSLALVRGVDGRRGLVHLLCPLRSAEAAAAGIVAVQVGHASLELPPALLAGGVVPAAAAGGAVSAARRGGDYDSDRKPIAVSASPYLAPWCLAAGGTGARAAKARNDLARGGGARS